MKLLHIWGEGFSGAGGVGNVCEREETLIQKTPRINCGASSNPCLGSGRNQGLNYWPFTFVLQTAQICHLLCLGF